MTNFHNDNNELDSFEPKMKWIVISLFLTYCIVFALGFIIGRL
jgi:hypothetical protein